MFDEEGYIIPIIFAKISSKIFAFFGLIELYIGLFHSELTVYGIGNNYLLILCAPIMILYDYKKNYEIHIKPFEKINLGGCINFFVSIFFLWNSILCRMISLFLNNEHFLKIFTKINLLLIILKLLFKYLI